MKKTALLIVLIMMFMLIIPACQTSGEKTQPPTSTTQAPVWDQPPGELILYNNLYHTPDHPGITPWVDDVISREITRLTNTTVSVLDIDEGQKIREIMRMGVYDVDLFIAYGVTLDPTNKLYDYTPYLAAWDELSQKYCPDFFEGLDPLEILYNQTDDGHVCTLSSAYYGPDQFASPYDLPDYSSLKSANALALRTDVLKDLGVDKVESVEQLDELLYAVKANRGKWKTSPDAVYQTSYSHWNSTDTIHYPATPVLMAMGVHTQWYWDEENQRMRPAYTDSKWLDYFQMIARWYKDGILPKKDSSFSYEFHPGFASRAYFDYIEKRIAGVQTLYGSSNSIIQYNYPSAGIMAFAQDVFWESEVILTNTVLREKERGGDPAQPDQPAWRLMAEPLTYQGTNQMVVQECFQTGLQYANYYITAQSSKQEGAIRLMAFLNNEAGRQLAHWGMEGEHYLWDGELVDMLVDPYEKITTKDDQFRFQAPGVAGWIKQNVSWEQGYVNYSQRVLYGNANNAQRDVDDAQAWQKALKQAAGYNPILTGISHNTQYFMEKYWFDMLPQLFLAPNEATVIEIWNQMQYRFATDYDLIAIENEMTARYLQAIKPYQDQGYDFK